jgi:hypothetical protein
LCLGRWQYRKQADCHYAGSEGGTVVGAQLIYKAGSVIGDYHGQMNIYNFEKWMKEKLSSSSALQLIVLASFKTFSSVTWSTTNLTWTDLGSNLEFCGDRPVTIRLSQDTAQKEKKN